MRARSSPPRTASRTATARARATSRSSRVSPCAVRAFAASPAPSTPSSRFPIKGGKLYLSGHNPLMRLDYPGAIGLKTGYTDAAGRCFVGVARRGGRTLGVVLLNSRDPAVHAPKLLNAAFAAER